MNLIQYSGTGSKIKIKPDEYQTLFKSSSSNCPVDSYIITNFDKSDYTNETVKIQNEEILIDTSEPIDDTVLLKASTKNGEPHYMPLMI